MSRWASAVNCLVAHLKASPRLNINSKPFQSSLEKSMWFILRVANNIFVLPYFFHLWEMDQVIRKINRHKETHFPKTNIQRDFLCYSISCCDKMSDNWKEERLAWPRCSTHGPSCSLTRNHKHTYTLRGVGLFKTQMCSFFFFFLV